MKVWCDSVTAAGKGATQDTYDSVGTVTLKKGAQSILGFIALVVPSGLTAGENGVPILQVDSQDLGISRQRFVVASALTDAISTNDKEAPVFAEFIPFRAPAGKSLENAKIEFSLSGSVTTTAGWTAAIGVVFADSEPDQNYVSELISLITPRVSGGAVAFSRAGISATTATSFSSGISVTSDANELVGILGFVNPNAPTAGEETCGIFELQASQVNDFSPQRWPFVLGWTPSLGTPVGTPVVASRWGGLYYPTRFELPRVNFTIEVSMKLAAALTNAGDGIAAVKWR